MTLELAPQAAVSGLLLGGIYALIALALAPAVIYILFGLALLFRPRGLFGRGSIA